jgi:hypothetical protein
MSEYAPPSDAADIGSGHRAVFKQFDGEPSGLDWWHPRPDGSWCKGWIDFRGSRWAVQFGPDTGWKVEQPEPLTLSPSLLCRVCGVHGYIREGKWVPA